MASSSVTGGYHILRAHADSALEESATSDDSLLTVGRVLGETTSARYLLVTGQETADGND